MTGVGGRPEVIIETAENMNGPWKEVDFHYKPGNLSEAPKFLLPHQPRLDWQMWFAALGSYEQNPWFVSLLYRILENKKEISTLLDRKRSKIAPKFVRSKLYKYHFTEENWWTREEIGDYSPVISKDDPPAVQQYLEKIGILTPLKSNQKPTNLVLLRILTFLRKQATKIPHHYLVWSVSWIILPILCNF